MSTGRLGALYRLHFRDARRERLFLASLAFFLAFAIVRIIVHAIRAGRGPFHDIAVGPTHIHHLVFASYFCCSLGTCGCCRSASSAAWAHGSRRSPTGWVRRSRSTSSRSG